MAETAEAVATPWVTVHPPIINGDTVTFTWDEPGFFPEQSTLFYRYQSLDLRHFSHELWMEVFLSLRLRAYGLRKTPIILQLPVPMPAATIAFWKTYHDAKLVTVLPVAAANHYSPWIDGAPPIASRSDAAVYFGGGRDSLASACLLGEVYGRDRVLLIQCVDPHGPGEQRRQLMEARYDRLSLGPARDVLGFQTQRVETNLHALMLQEGGRRLEPHLEQYTAGLLPVLLSWGAPLSTFGYAWVEYAIVKDEVGEWSFRYGRSRPEILAAQSLHYSRVFGFAHALVNVNLTLTGILAFQLLARRYPDAFPFIMTCQHGKGERWCHKCRRCGYFAGRCLAEGIDGPEFDLNRYLATSPWMLQVVESLKDVEAPPPGQNAPWNALFPSLQWAKWCNGFYSADPAFAHSRLGSDAWFAFLLVTAMYGNKYDEAFVAVPRQAFDFLPLGLAAALRAIIEQYIRVVDTMEEPLITGQGEILGPFRLPFHHPLLDLPHLQ